MERKSTATRTVAGRYRLVAPLGSGGMGTVWRAEDLVLGREVAVKEITFPHGLADDDREVLRERTRREARAAARLDHPSAVTVYDVVEEDGAPYLVMELVEARTLAEVVRSDGPLTPQRTAQVGLAVLGALRAAHKRGIVHRDVKPGNVLLCGDAAGGAGGRVVLTDFGIATSAGDASITSTGLLLGSPAYIAPERARGLPPGPPSDLWSLGATLFTAVEGRPPFDAGEPMATVTAVVTGEHEPYAAAGPLEPVLEGLLERDPERRLDAASAARALEAVAREPRSGPAAPARPATAAVARAADRTTALPIPSATRREAGPAPTPTASPSPAPPRPRPVRPVSAARPARRRRAVIPLVLAAVLLLGALAGGIALLTGGGADRSPQAGGTSAAPSASQEPTPDEEPAPTEEPADPSPTPSSPPPSEPADDSSAAPAPEGWRSFTGGPGWVAAVPPSYAVSTFSGSPQYKDEDTGRTLRISTTGPGGGKDDAVQDRRIAAADFAGRQDDYQEISIGPVDYRGYEAADWEATYSDGGASLHLLSRVFVVDGRGYSLFFQTRSTDDWEQARAQFEQIAASFQPV